ncbi:MAG: von Willebrand factor, type [Candidatus Angelobacter sp.]|jgi:Ca-activated chloride channel family protein|nr:von Willebrand factor, type [Candidatus Angelobacter sp.]
MSMPERDTMRLRNKHIVGTTFFMLLGATSFWGTQGQTTQPQQNQQRVQATPIPPDIDPSDPALPSWAKPAAPAPGAATASKPTPPANVPPGQQSGQQQSFPGNEIGQVTKNQGQYIYRSQVNEVILPVIVTDTRRHIVSNLDKNNFLVYEDGQPQTIVRFSREDVPVSIGIVVDNSGSMRTKRAAVTKAVLNLIQASNPQDEVFIVNFNDDPYLDQDFTSKLEPLREALDRVDSRGGTALYDAVIASADHLAKGAKKEKKVLLVITDGVDNESRESLESAIRKVQDDQGPIIYTIGILGDEPGIKRAKRALQSLSDQTAGVAFFPKDLAEVDEISQEVARDIRNQYSIMYKPTNPRSNGGYRHVKVEARAQGYKDLQARTRDGYFADEKRTASTKQ